MSPNRPENTLRRLRGFVELAARDVKFRALLERQPTQAFRQAGFVVTERPANLEVNVLPTGLVIDASTVFGWPSAIKADPILTDQLAGVLVSCRAKPLALLHGSEHYALAAFEWARRRGMAALLSSLEFQPRMRSADGGYSNSMASVRSARPGSGWWRALLVSWDLELACVAWLALLFGWDDLLGGLLGYPECCRTSFRRRWPAAQLDFAGDVAMVTAESGDSERAFPWGLNVYGRYFGFELIQHFPCDFDCQDSLSIAKRNHGTLRLFRPALAASLEQQLRSIVMLPESGGVILLPGASRACEGESNAFSYDPRRMLTTVPESAPSLSLASGRRVSRRRGASEWQCGGSPIRARLVDFTLSAERSPGDEVRSRTQ